jgi:hypothetical protein
MPYIALQLVGLQVVVGALGVSGGGLAADLPLIIAFIILAAFTYSSGLRAPASIAIVKDILIYITAFAAAIVIPIQLGGLGKIFAAVPAQKLLLAAPAASTTGAYGTYATLALGSALALFLYPHSVTGILSASSGRAIRRNPALPIFPSSRQASKNSATISPYQRCCCTASRRGLLASPLRPSVLAPSCRPRSCRSRPRTSTRATSIASSSTRIRPIGRKPGWPSGCRGS